MTLYNSSAASGVNITDPSFEPDNTSAPTILAISGTSAESGQLLPGYYEIRSPVDFFFAQGNSGQTATTSSRVVFGGESKLIKITGSNDEYIAAITNGASVNLSIEKIG